MAFISSDIPSTSNRYTAADWIELQAIEASSNSYSFSKIYRMIDILDDVDDRVTDDSNSEDYREVENWLDELKVRKSFLGDSYPFEIMDKSIKYLDIADKNLKTTYKFGRVTYLLSLLFTHANGTLVLQDKKFLDLSNNVKDREMFQICSTFAAAGYLSGSSISFGYPRAEGLTFGDALVQVIDLVFDGAKIRKKPHASAPKAVKDFELDIISWIPTNDNFPSKTIMIGQVATGVTDWKSKSLSREQFQLVNRLWLEDGFASDNNLTTAMFIPFCIEPKNKGASISSELHGSIGGLITNTIFYRYRTPYYVQRLYELEKSNTCNFNNINKVEGFNHNVVKGDNDFSRVETYVLKKIAEIKYE